VSRARNFGGSWPPNALAEPFHLFETAPTTAERRRRVDEVLEQVGLRAQDAARLPHEFSGEQRQRSTTKSGYRSI